jgi:uncharacterized protein
MNSIYIPHLLNAVNRTRSLTFETNFENLDTLTPVRAQVSVRHGSTFLDVQGSAQTIVTLTCDRCLQQYNHRVSVNAKEIIWLEDDLVSQEMPLEQEVNPEDLVESLSPYGYFDPETWIYEQVCLELPQRQICDAACQGLEVEDNGGAQPKVDERWSALESLKRQLAADESHPN